MPKSLLGKWLALLGGRGVPIAYLPIWGLSPFRGFLGLGTTPPEIWEGDWRIGNSERRAVPKSLLGKWLALL